MRVRRSNTALRLFSIVCILTAVVLFVVELISFSRIRANFPTGLTIAGVPVGGLNRLETAERLLEVYSLPLEVHYDEAVIHINPASIDFKPNIESMLAAADIQRTNIPFWNGFLDFLLGNPASPQSVPLDATYSEATLRAYLSDEIAIRYDKPSTAAQPLVGTVNFQSGSQGTTIDIDVAVFQIENALRSPTNRVVDLPLRRTDPNRPSLQNLQILLQQTIELTGYDGLAGVYMQDLQTGQEIHFLYLSGSTISTKPDIAFTAASIIKIPIMVSVFQSLDGDLPSEAEKLMTEMITESGNDPADWLMEQYLDPDRGPLVVTEVMNSLGLENTFLAGHFRLGSPLLAFYETPANTREDVSADPDTYNQTTLTDMGILLADIYQCAQTGGGNLVAVFPGEINQSECQQMIDLLTKNFLGSLIEAGAPEGTPIAHKHGWIQNEIGVINTIGDAGIVFSPSGDYVLTIFFYHPIQLIWDPISTLIGDLSRAVYNYYNLPLQ